MKNLAQSEGLESGEKGNSSVVAKSKYDSLQSLKNSVPTPAISKIVFKTGSPAEIPSRGEFDTVFLAGISEFKMDLVEAITRLRQILKPNGQLCLLTATDEESLIYYGMENGFDFLKSETINNIPLQCLVRNRQAGAGTLFFTFSGSKWNADYESGSSKDSNNMQITGVWLVRN